MRLREVATGQVVVLSDGAVIGRAQACALRILDTAVAPHHATVTLDGEAWMIRDLRTRNGTSLGGPLLRPGMSHPLHAGSVITFGDPRNAWEVIE